MEKNRSVVSQQTKLASRICVCFSFNIKIDGEKFQFNESGEKQILLEAY